jgi:hypothetical protein
MRHRVWHSYRSAYIITSLRTLHFSRRIGRYEASCEHRTQACSDLHHYNWYAYAFWGPITPSFSSLDWLIHCVIPKRWKPSTRYMASHSIGPWP